MRTIRLAGAFAASCLLLAGCVSSIELQRVNPADPGTAVGLPHPLMFTRYEVTASWQLVGCKTGDGQEMLVVQASVELGAPGPAPDPENLFVIDPRSLSSAFKSGQVKVEYAASGAPVAVNAKIDDRTAEVVGAVAALGAGLAKFEAVPKIQSTVAPDDKAKPAKPPKCSDDAAKAVAQELELRNEVKANTERLDDQLASLRRLSEVVAAAGPNVDDTTKKALVAQLQQTAAARKALQDSAAKHARALDKVRYRVARLWPADGGRWRTEAGDFTLPIGIVDGWRPKSVGKDEMSSADWLGAAKLEIHLALSGRDGLARKEPPEVRTDLGIPLRLGVEGELTACLGASCGKDVVPIARRADRVLQLGPVFYLPCRSRPFSDVECSYALDDAGRLKSAGAVFANAAAESALGALNEAVKQATEARSARSTAETKRLEAEAAYLKARKAVEDAQAASAADPDAATKAESTALLTQAARLDAERALIEAELALAEARQRQAPRP